MPLEATMIVLDNSEWMRNGDYPPTRFGAQTDAATAVFRTKIDSNQENTVGVMTMAAKGPEVLVTHTKEMGELLAALHSASSKLAGTASIPTAIAIAQLALKHRQNKNLRQRVLVFVGSPLQDSSAEAERALIRLAKKLKKNNVALDVVAFGDGVEEAGEGGRSILRAFVDAASSSDNSHYIAVPAGTHLLSDAVLGSSVLAADRNIPEGAMGVDGAADGAGGAGGDFAFGIDPSLDPELAMALRMSMEEEAARQAAAAAQTSASSADAAPSSSTPASAPASTAAAGATRATEPAPAADDEDERLLQQALAISEGRDVEMSEESAAGAEAEEDLTEEEMIARAIEMSMQNEDEGESGKGGK